MPRPVAPPLSRPASRAITRAARRSQGFALIESLIALLIFMLATLGLVGLQMSMTRATSGAKFRADAAYLANDLVGTMWTDAPANRASYATASCADYARCAAWEGRLNARLPGASYEITPSGGSGQVAITIRWTVPDEGSHAFTTSTAINTNL